MTRTQIAPLAELQSSFCWMKACGLVALVALLPAGVSATTWDEPWVDEVISNAESFVRVNVVANRSGEVNAHITQHLAGTETPNEIRIAGYSLLHLESYSVPETELRFKTGSDYYLFLKKAERGGGYLVATPTTGWAKVTADGVYATYRHSYHQAVVPEHVYEMTMVAIFDRVHGIKGDETQVRRFLSTELSKPPAVMKGGTDDTRAQFFLQHAALETFHYLGSEKDLPLIDPFLKTDDFHVQISAVRAVSGVRSKATIQRLMDFIEAERYGFAKVMAVWGLRDQGATSTLPRLKKFVADGKDEETGFGGNLMDPRVGTRFPESIKDAVNEVINTWDKASSNQAVQRTGASRSAQETNSTSPAAGSRR